MITKTDYIREMKKNLSFIDTKYTFFGGEIAILTVIESLYLIKKTLIISKANSHIVDQIKDMIDSIYDLMYEEKIAVLSLIETIKQKKDVDFSIFAKSPIDFIDFIYQNKDILIHTRQHIKNIVKSDYQIALNMIKTACENSYINVLHNGMDDYDTKTKIADIRTW